MAAAGEAAAAPCQSGTFGCDLGKSRLNSRNTAAVAAAVLAQRQAAMAAIRSLRGAFAVFNRLPFPWAGSRRQLHVQAVSAADNTLQVEFSDGSTATVPRALLKDACSCGECWNSDTHQRQAWRVDASLADTATPEASVTDGGDVAIRWDDSHSSHFTASALQRLARPTQGGFTSTKSLGARTPWDASLTKQPRVAYYDMLCYPALKTRMLQHLWRTGWCIVEDAPCFDAAVTASIGAVVGPPRETRMYGVDYHVRVEPGGGNDSSYGHDAIGPHTDGTYLSRPPGVQVFHCWKAHVPSSHPTECSGVASLPGDDGAGKTVLVDGMRVAKEMAERFPDAYDMLCRRPLQYEFKDAEDWMVAEHTVFTPQSGGEFGSMAFNNHDRCPVVGGDAEDVYAALAKLCGILGDPQNQLWFQLQPGEVLLLHNHRVLHGRGSFPADSSRHLYGFYLDNDDLMSQIRMRRWQDGLLP